MRGITVSVPSTSANLGPGYDCLGLALNLRHRVTFEAMEEPGLQITARGEDVHLIPTDESNLVYQSMQLVFRRVGDQPPGLHIQQENEIPVASGLGSSSSAVLAGMFGANALAGSPLSREEILQMATDLEGHPDNVAPAVYGGLILGIQTKLGLFVEPIDIPDLEIMVVLPDFKLATEDARAALPGEIPLSDAIYNTSRIGLLIRALETADYDRMEVAMRDHVHQPYRIPLIPGMKEAMVAARKAGASGVALSGAGPSLIAFAAHGLESIGDAAAEAFRAKGMASRQWRLTVDHRGTVIHNIP